MTGPVEIQMEVRGLEQSRLIEYLVQAGGRRIGRQRVRGTDWSVHVKPMEPARVGPFVIHRHKLLIRGPSGSVERVRQHLRSRCMRGGG